MHLDLVRQAVLHLGRRVGCGARWSCLPGSFLHRLVQRAAERDVGLLEAAADREQRHAARERPRDQRQRPVVARRVQRQGRVVHVLAEVAAGARWTASRSAARRRPGRAARRSRRSSATARPAAGSRPGARRRRTSCRRRGTGARRAAVAGRHEHDRALAGSVRSCGLTAGPSGGSRPCPAPAPACAAAARRGRGGGGCGRRCRSGWRRRRWPRPPACRPGR